MTASNSPPIARLRLKNGPNSLSADCYFNHFKYFKIKFPFFFLYWGMNVLSVLIPTLKKQRNRVWRSHFTYTSTQTRTWRQQRRQYSYLPPSADQQTLTGQPRTYVYDEKKEGNSLNNENCSGDKISLMPALFWRLWEICNRGLFLWDWNKDTHRYLD